VEAQVSDKNTVIIGAGAAGLAVAACLQKHGVPFVLLESSDQVGQAWRNHYDRLHLHTDRSSSGLPFWPMPKSFPKYPKRAQVVEYLELYAGHYNLEPKFGQEVVSADYQDGAWETQTGTAVYRSPNLVVATGYTRVPNVPVWPGQQAFQGPVLHSSAYKNGRAFAGKKVLVVGFGNSAAEIAIDLSEQGAEYVGMSVRHPVNVIPRDIVGLPILSVGKVMDYLPPKVADLLARPMIMLTIGDLTKYGLRKLPYGPNVQIRQDGQIPVLDIGTVKLIKNGRIGIHPSIKQFTEDSVVFVNGAEEKFDAVVLGTGYKPQVNAFLNGAAGVLNGDGTPVVSGEEAAPGLFFCGFYISPTGMLREIGIEAKKIGMKIAQM
jgi:cation diffusion facilitator CzcD-associated flavoprotein CzcO